MAIPSDSPHIDGIIDLPVSRKVTTLASPVTFSGAGAEADHFALGFGDRTIARPLVRIRPNA